MKKIKTYKCSCCKDVIVCHGNIEHKKGEPCEFCDRIKKEFLEKGIPELMTWAKNEINEYQEFINTLKKLKKNYGRQKNNSRSSKRT